MCEKWNLLPTYTSWTTFLGCYFFTGYLRALENPGVLEPLGHTFYTWILFLWVPADRIAESLPLVSFFPPCLFEG